MNYLEKATLNNFECFTNQQFSCLGKNSDFKGEVFLYGPTHIQSNFEGFINIKNPFPLTIQFGGSVKGDIECSDIEIHGTFEGVIKATGIVYLHSSARVIGEINAKELKISPGAIFNGDAHTLEEN